MAHAIKISPDVNDASAHKSRNTGRMGNSVLQAKSETTEVAGAFEPETSEKKFAAGGSGKPRNGFERNQGFIRSQGFVRNFISRKPASNSGGAEAGPQFQQMLSSSKGRGISLPSGVKREMETGFGTNLSSVRLHTDSNAIQMSREIKAQAFTHGQDIYFNRGKFDTQSTNGRGLLAHELTHTLQQRNVSPGVFQPLSMQVDGPDSPLEREANEGARRILSLSADPSSVRGVFRASPAHGNTLHALSEGEKLPQDQISNWGTFKALKYHPLRIQNAVGPEVGVEMHMEFHPGKNVDASKIGLTQAIDFDIDGKEAYENRLLDKTGEYMNLHSAKSGPGAGYHIDQLIELPNPVYQAKEFGGGKKADKTDPANYSTDPVVPKTPKEITDEDAAHANDPNYIYGITTNGIGDWGYRYDPGSGTIEHPSSLSDIPSAPGTNAPNTHQLFETAAYAVDGTQEGTYYGSVTWGWERDGSGNFSMRDFKIKSMGIPSADFLTAASIWNDSKTDWEYEVIVDNIMAWTPASTSNGVAPAVDQPKVKKGEKLSKRAPNKIINGNVYVNVGLSSKPEGDKWLIRQSDLQMVLIGEETINLPVPDVFKVSGTDVKLSQSETPTPEDPVLPEGTRVLSRGNSTEFNGFVKVEVIESGKAGLVKDGSLKKEELGTR